MESINYEKETYVSSEIIIDFKKIFFIIWSRKFLITKIFISVLVFFILLTFILPKKWKVEADLYIKQSNSTNYTEINPYAIEEASGLASILSNNNPLINEIELMKSPLVIDPVIKENDLKYKKLFGIFPTIKTGQYITTEKFLKKAVKFDNKKGTDIVSISFTSKDKDEAYGVVTSIISNYIELHKELNSEKSKSDKKIIETEYNKAKSELTNKVSKANGLPTTSLAGTGNLAAMSAFSNSAQTAMSTLKGQYLAGEKARVDIEENAAKVTQLSTKLEWAKLVEEMSGASKVVVIKEPQKLKVWEYASPKLLTNILLGIVFGFIFSLFGIIFKEIADKKLTYSMLGESIIYSLDKDFQKLSAFLVANLNKNFIGVYFEDLPIQYVEKIKNYRNITLIKANISETFSNTILKSDGVITFASINETNAENYKIIKNMVGEMNKKILKEVIV